MGKIYRHRNGLLALTLLIALLLHLGLLWLPIPSTLMKKIAPASKDKGEIVIEPLTKTEKPVVQSSRVKEQEETKEEARYVGEFRNRVKKETRSPVKGKFREGFIARGEGGAGSGDGNEKERPQTEGKTGAKGLKLRDLMAFGSSPNDFSNDKKLLEGNETVLNTDRFLYASFINRIADEIYDPWVQNARDAISLLYLEGRKLESNLYVTRIQIVMDESGSVRAIQTLKSSGVDSLDEATKKAFWASEPFPHPPEQMFGKESLVRFIYEFHFEWKTSSFNIIPSAI